MCKNNIEDDDRYEFKGVKIAHELMVDILGALIPGALFLFCTIVCIVFPLICYAKPDNNFGFLMKDGDWFWIVAFLSFLILSYVIGLIFYRSDIKVPDRCDIQREQNKKLSALLNKIPSHDIHAAEDYVAGLLIQEISPLKNCLETYIADNKNNQKVLNPVYGQEFVDCCKECLDELANTNQDNRPSDDTTAQYNSSLLQENLLKVLFPECDFKSPEQLHSNLSVKKNELFPQVEYIPDAVQKVIQQASTILPKVEKHIRFSNDGEKDHSILNRLIVSYMILHMQNESGCATEDRCDFPYMSYYKYLLKRELKGLLQYVKWSTPATRTKNQLNQYKIELQLHVPNAFSIITKNESHIRMASSSWHVARVIKGMSICTGVAMLLFAVIGAICHESGQMSKCGFVGFIDSYMPFLSNTNLSNEYLAVLFPLFTFLLARYILISVPQFIHYQRLREIYYTMTIYNLWRDADRNRDARYRQNLAIRRAEAGIPPESTDNDTQAH